MISSRRQDFAAFPANFFSAAPNKLKFFAAAFWARALLAFYLRRNGFARLAFNHCHDFLAAAPRALRQVFAVKCGITIRASVLHSIH